MPKGEETERTAYQSGLPWGEQELKPTERKGFIGSLRDALTGGAQTRVVWDESQGNPYDAVFSPPGEIPEVPEGSQIAFYGSAEDGALKQKWSEKGDRRLIPKKKKEPPKKRPRKGNATFKNVIEFEARQRAAIYGDGIDKVETVNAGQRIENNTRGTVQVSTVGETGLRFRTEKGSRKPPPNFSTLSASEQALWRKRRAEERQAVDELKRQARENELRERAAQQKQGQVFASDGHVSPKSIYPGKAENVRWETVRRMIQGVRDALK